jgi:death-on-curing protein
MTKPDDLSPDNLQAKLQFHLTERVDFADPSTESTLVKVRALSAAAMYFNVVAITEFGGRPGSVRQGGLVEHIVGAAFQTFAGEQPHPSPFDKAAVLLRGITQGHPFTDGNKRTGFLLALYYLDAVGYVLRRELPVAEIIDFCRRVSAGEIRDLTTMAATLEAWTEPRP